MASAFADFNAAVQYHRAGDLEQAAQICSGILQSSPDDFNALQLLGLIALQRGQLPLAAQHLLRAVQLRPDVAAVHCNLALAWAGQGKLEQAIASFRQAARLQPDLAESHNNLGVALMQRGDLAEAAASLRQAVTLRPDYAEAQQNLGTALQGLGNLNEAVDSFFQAVRARPDYLEAHQSLASIFFTQGRLDEAGRHYRRVVELKPDDWAAHFQLGSVLKDQGDLAGAVQCWQRTVQLRPDYAEARSNLAAALQELGRVDEAVAGFRETLQLQPDLPDVHHNLAMALLLSGDFEQGWREYEWRERASGVRPISFPQPRWHGEPLAGRQILLHTEQGLGDTFQFVRYAQLVKDRGGKVLLLAPEKLAPILRSCPGVDAWYGKGDTLPDFDVYSPLQSLPYLCGTRLASIPAQVPYLFADKALVAEWRGKLADLDGYKVGIHWQGNPNYKADRQRSIPLAQFAPLASVPGVRLISLQRGFGTEQLSAASFPVHDLGDAVDRASGPFMDTAAILRNLDLVITSDTSLPHLAGALGVPVWVALPFVPDWRWLLGRSDSPWYPTMRLFRQQRPGDWTTVFRAVRTALQERMQGQAANG